MTIEEQYLKETGDLPYSNKTSHCSPQYVAWLESKTKKYLALVKANLPINLFKVQFVSDQSWFLKRGYGTTRDENEAFLFTQEQILSLTSYYASRGSEEIKITKQ